MGSGIFAILDDIGALLDDVATASKVASQKTAGILGDDLAVNAEKATGFVSSRELPVLWAITKGSFINKLIIVPIAIILNIFFPVAIKYILMLGGCYLAYEGVEKIIEYFFHKNHSKPETTETPTTENSEKEKVKSAITTDFILSIEIVIIALGSVINKPLSIQIVTVCIVAILATVGVYGIVALIVRMDDAGFGLINKSKDKGVLAKLGHFLVNALPIVIKMLGIIGTIALVLVSGGIFTHSIEYLHHFLPQVPAIFKDLSIGLIVGSLVFILISIFQFFIKALKTN